MKPSKFLEMMALIFFPVLFPAIRAQGQAAPPQFFWVCYAGVGNQPNVYVSGIMQGPAASGAAFRTGFVQTLMQRYAYQGQAVCAPAQNLAAAQNGMNARATAWRNAKKNVVETGWIGTAQAAAAPAGSAPNLLGGLLNPITPATAPATPAAPVAAAGQAPKQATGSPAGATGPQGAPQGGNSGGAATAANVLAAIFGNSPPAGAAGSTAGAAGGAAAGAKAQGQSKGQAAGQAGKAAAGNAAATNPNAAPAVQVASTLSGLFKKGPNGSDPAPAGNAARPETPAANGEGGRGPGGAPGNASGGLPAGALGSAKFGDAMLVVYGCGRQGADGTQVLCVTDLTNQNAKDTLLQSAAQWKDAFIVDDRGDRHARSNGYFLNIDGEQRQQMDVDYGKSAHFILAFDGVPAKVEKITLRSTTGGLNVANISLIAVGAADASGAQAQPSAQQAPFGAPQQAPSAAGTRR